MGLVLFFCFFGMSIYKGYTNIWYDSTAITL